MSEESSGSSQRDPSPTGPSLVDTAQAPPLGRRDLITAVAIFIGLFALLYNSKVLQISDSKYTMLFSEQLAINQTLNVAEYFAPHVDSSDYPKAKPDTHWPRHVREVNGRLYPLYPPGTAALSSPFVAVARLFGVSTIDSDGRYNSLAEDFLQRLIAAILMAAVSVVFYFTARVCLDQRWSLLVAIAGALSTQIWSTASRGMWSHTWDIVLLALVLFHLFKEAKGQTQLRPILVATLLSWAFFVRPTAALFIIPIGLYVCLCRPKSGVLLAITGLAWLGLFIAFSYSTYESHLPIYYQKHSSKLDFSTWALALSAQLISPSRGLLVYVPVLLMCGYALIRYRQHVAPKALCLTCVIIVLFHHASIATFNNWWAGVSYGPRFSTDIVPVFVLLGVIGLRAALDFRALQAANPDTPSTERRHRVEYVVLWFCIAWGMFANGAGALTNNDWNRNPQPIKEDPMRTFDWSDPQFLRGL